MLSPEMLLYLSGRNVETRRMKICQPECYCSCQAEMFSRQFGRITYNVIAVGAGRILRTIAANRPNVHREDKYFDANAQQCPPAKQALL